MVAAAGHTLGLGPPPPPFPLVAPPLAAAAGKGEAARTWPGRRRAPASWASRPGTTPGETPGSAAALPDDLAAGAGAEGLEDTARHRRAPPAHRPVTHGRVGAALGV